jgi:hypothetical protein
MATEVKITKSSEFDIGDRVYENFIEGMEGIVIDFTFRRSTGRIAYTVRWNDSTIEECEEVMLSPIQVVL